MILLWYSYAVHSLFFTAGSSDTGIFERTARRLSLNRRKASKSSSTSQHQTPPESPEARTKKSWHQRPQIAPDYTEPSARDQRQKLNNSENCDIPDFTRDPLVPKIQTQCRKWLVLIITFIDCIFGFFFLFEKGCINIHLIVLLSYCRTWMSHYLFRQ